MTDKSADRMPSPQTFVRIHTLIACLMGPFLIMMGLPWLALVWIVPFALVYVPLVWFVPVIHEWFFTCLVGYYLLTSAGIWVIGRRRTRTW